MTFTKTIPLHESLREVVLLRPKDHMPDSAVDWEARIREAEAGGYERGRRDGEKALSEQLLRQRADMFEAHQGVVESLRRLVPDLVAQTENVLISLALEAARKLVAGLPISAEVVTSVVRDAISQVDNATEFTIYLHAEDLALLKKIQSPLLSPTPGGDKLTFHASKEVARGGCLVQTRFGVLDAQRSTKMDQLKRSLAVEDVSPESMPALASPAPA